MIHVTIASNLIAWCWWSINTKIRIYQLIILNVIIHSRIFHDIFNIKRLCFNLVLVIWILILLNLLVDILKRWLQKILLLDTVAFVYFITSINLICSICFVRYMKQIVSNRKWCRRWYQLRIILIYILRLLVLRRI